MENVLKIHPKYTFNIKKTNKLKNYTMNTKVLKIAVLFVLANLFACNTSQDSGKKTETAFLYEDGLESVEEEMPTGIYDKAKRSEMNIDDIGNLPGGIKPAEADPNHNTEEYDKIVENEFLDSKQNPLSTFSIDVDNAAYSNVRRMLNYNEMPDKGAVRIEEMINYFTYDYPEPTGKHPFSFNTEISDCPWNKENKLIHIGLQGKKLDYNDLKPILS